MLIQSQWTNLGALTWIQILIWRKLEILALSYIATNIFTHPIEVGDIFRQMSSKLVKEKPH